MGKWVGKKYVMKVDLTHESIQKAIADIEILEQDLLEKVDEFTRKLAEKGVEYAKIQLLHYGAYQTGKLYNSIHLEKGDVIQNGAQYIVKTDCDYAIYVEFGTGVVGNSHPHPSGDGVYRTTGWGFTPVPEGWRGKVYHNKDGSEVAFTIGQASKPFMWDTRQFLSLNSTIREVAKEVFG